MLYFFGRALQVAAMMDLAYALYAGLSSGGGMWSELELLVLGIVLFAAGRWMEARGAGG
ncbi:MAG: hypothetical protein ACE5JJ_01855 [Nitrospinota bacterium]